MTRLVTEMIDNLPLSLPEYDLKLKKQTGCSLLEVAVRAVGYEPLPDFSSFPVAVVPVTAGEGVIPGFCTALKAISSHLGFPANITGSSDVAGFAEALDTGAKLILLADDRKFMAFNVLTGKYSDNSKATGIAFVTALDCASKGLSGKKAAVLGLGPVGRAAVGRLIKLGAEPVVFDPNPEPVSMVQNMYPVETAASVSDCLVRTPFVIDCSPASNFISAEFISKESLVASPGVPVGLTLEALEKINPDCFIHDPLQLGVAVMLLESLAESNKPVPE